MFFLFFSFFLLCFPLSFSVVCVCMCFFDCKCKSLKRLGENIKTTERNRKTTEQLEEQHKQQQYRISSPRTSANNLCDLFAEVRGLEILYFCCFLMFFFEYLCFVYVSFFFKKCFRLVFLSFCIYNRQNTYKNRTQHKNSKENITTNQTNINNRNLPARPLEIFIFRGGSWAGNPVFVVVVFL